MGIFSPPKIPAPPSYPTPPSLSNSIQFMNRSAVGPATNANMLGGTFMTANQGSASTGGKQLTGQ